MTYSIRIASSMNDIDASAWDACANPAKLVDSERDAEGLGERFNPFLTHAFLKALESSKSVGGRSGWTSCHALVEDENSRLVAVAPAYLKTHSQGEYVFDHAWADAYYRGGLDYYPKLQVAVPFTPATGRRLLTADPQDASAQAAVLAGLRAWREKADASSVHITFLTKPEWEMAGSVGYLQRTGQQFHFFNKGYGDFDAFLADLASRKRKMIKRERRDALADNGIAIEWLSGSALTEAHWDAFFKFYIDTGSRKWGQPYLTRKFFSDVGAAMADRILLVMAKRGGRYIAGALNFVGKDALYGRHWGAVEEHPFLHFEVCYYQAMDYAIQHKLARVEAGAQGEHKLARGYAAVATYSAHDIADKRYARAIDDYLQRERVHIDEALEEYGELAPFKKTC